MIIFEKRNKQTKCIYMKITITLKFSIIKQNNDYIKCKFFFYSIILQGDHKMHQPQQSSSLQKPSKSTSIKCQKIYIMIRQPLQKSFNEQQWKQIISLPQRKHFRIQNKIYQYLMNNQELFNKYFQLFFYNNVTLYHWYLLGCQKSYDISQYLNKKLLTKGFEDYRKEMRFIQLHLNKQKQRNKAKQKQMLKQKQRCKQRQRERQILKQKWKQQQKLKQQKQNFLQNQKYLLNIQKCQTQQQQHHREQSSEKQPSQPPIKQINFKQKFKQQQQKNIQQIRKYKIDDLSYQIFNFIANKSLTASLLVWQKPWSRNNNSHSSSLNYQKYCNKNFRGNACGGDQASSVEYKNNTLYNLNSSSTAATTINPKNNAHKKNNSNHNKSSRHTPYNNFQKQRQQSPHQQQPQKNKQQLLKQVNQKFFKNHDFHQLYIDTFNACDGPRYIFYNYEKHMKGLSQKDKYNMFIRGKSRNKFMDIRLTQLSDQQPIFKDIRSCDVNRVKSSYQYFPFGSAVEEGAKKKSSKVVFRKTKKGNCGKFIRK